MSKEFLKNEMKKMKKNYNAMSIDIVHDAVLP